MESILKVNDNQVAVLGGLMQDSYRNADRKTPFVGDIPILGSLFSAREQETLKTELVIFLRPLVIQRGSSGSFWKPRSRQHRAALQVRGGS
jgi:general secretion pathway protein D